MTTVCDRIMELDRQMTKSVSPVTATLTELESIAFWINTAQFQSAAINVTRTDDPLPGDDLIAMDPTPTANVIDAERAEEDGERWDTANEL